MGQSYSEGRGSDNRQGEWCTRQDSNLRPLAPELTTLSSGNHNVFNYLLIILHLSKTAYFAESTL